MSSQQSRPSLRVLGDFVFDETPEGLKCLIDDIDSETRKEYGAKATSHMTNVVISYLMDGEVKPKYEEEAKEFIRRCHESRELLSTETT